MTKSSFTGQDAPLEPLLAAARLAKIKSEIVDRVVLDFGCGLHAWNAKAMAQYVAHVDGIDPSIPYITQAAEDVTLYPRLRDLPRKNYERITALAVFEHINPFDLIEILHHLDDLSTPDAMILATVPTPASRRVLEILARRLHLVDRSQIDDHRVYYDDLWLQQILSQTPWRLSLYQKFQLGLNSYFRLSKQTSITKLALSP